jgi:carboxymethylenebutenolidase
MSTIDTMLMYCSVFAFQFQVGVTGFYMGGALSLATAALSSEVEAAAPFYGTPGKDLCDLKNIKCPVQCHFGNWIRWKGFQPRRIKRN